MHRSGSDETVLRRDNIARDLLLERIERREFLFVAKAGDERDFKFLFVKVAGEIKQMRFDAQFRRRIRQCGTMADIQHGPMGLAGPVDMHGINPERRQTEAAHVQVRGGEAKLVPELVSADDRTIQRIRAAKHLAGGVELPGADGLADARAADRLAIERDRSLTVDGKVQFLSQRLEQRDIAAAFVAKGKIAADANTVETAKIPDETADKLFAGQPAERFVEADQQRGLRTQRGDGAQFLRQSVNRWRHASGRDDCVGVVVEREHDRRSLVLGGIGERLADDLLVAQMHSIEHSDGDAHAMRRTREVGGGIDEVHRPEGKT